MCSFVLFMSLLLASRFTDGIAAGVVDPPEPSRAVVDPREPPIQFEIEKKGETRTSQPFHPTNTP